MASVSIQTSDSDGLNLSGVETITVSAQPSVNLQRIEIYIDGQLKLSAPGVTLSYFWDTTSVSDGTHILKGVAVYKTRKPSATLAVTVNNSVVVPPVLDPPVNTALPTISGIAQVGQTLTGTSGTWSGKAPINYSFAWLRSGVVVGVAATYTPVIADIGIGLLFKVVANNTDGTTTAFSEHTALVIAATTPPPPVTGLSPIGWLNNDWNGWWPPTNADKYGIAGAYKTAPSSFKGIGLRYSTAVTCYPNNNKANGLSAEEAIAGGWILKDSLGNLIKRGAPYTDGYVADIGHPGYQQAFGIRLLELIASQGAKGSWIDDSGPRIMSMVSVRPAKYPTDASYEVAVLSFASYIHTLLKSKGLVDVYNTQVPSDNDAALTKAWFARIGPVSGGLCVEGWMTPSGPATAVRKVGTDWRDQWDNWRSIHKVCQQAGTHFFSMNWIYSQVYCLATFLLDWDGKTGSCQWNITKNYVANDDPWSAVYDRAFVLGQPTGIAVKSGNIWTRPFTGGTVTVDPVAATASIA